MRILVVEDEPKIAEAVKQGLAADGHDVTVAGAGEEGFFLAQTRDFDLMVFDIMLPGRNGLEILANLRRAGHRNPILLLTSKDAVEDRVRGLNAGADDYLCKPFAIAELQARVRALGRRNATEPATIFTVEDLQVDRLRHTANRAGKALDLTAREFELLEYLTRHVDQVVSREMLARDVWKEPARHTPIDNVIDVHIARLRRKLDEPFPKRLLHTVRGVGFVIRSDPE